MHIFNSREAVPRTSSTSPFGTHIQERAALARALVTGASLPTVMALVAAK